MKKFLCVLLIAFLVLPSFAFADSLSKEAVRATLQKLYEDDDGVHYEVEYHEPTDTYWLYTSAPSVSRIAHAAASGDETAKNLWSGFCETLQGVAVDAYELIELLGAENSHLSFALKDVAIDSGDEDGLKLLLLFEDGVLSFDIAAE